MRRTAIGSGEGSKIKNVFIKVNDDSIAMGKSNMNVDNATVWRQRWGSVINLSWNLASHRTNKDLNLKYIDPIESSELNGLNVIRFEPVPQEILKGNNEANNNAAIVTARNLMGGTIKDFAFKTIVVEDSPYEIINLQLDDTNTYKSTKRNLEQDQLDGIGKINDITFDGLFTKAPQEIEQLPDVSNSYQIKDNARTIQKSVFSIADEIFDQEYYGKCIIECENECDQDSHTLCEEKCENVKTVIGSESSKIVRSISGVKLNNICINEGNEIIGPDIKGVTSLNITDYFKFKEGVENHLTYNGKPPTEDEKDGYIPYTGVESSFEEISGDDAANSAEITCGKLEGVNMCTLENYRNLCQ